MSDKNKPDAAAYMKAWEKAGRPEPATDVFSTVLRETLRDKWPVRVRPFKEPPEDGWKCVSFERDGEGTYGNVSIECPCCEHEWDENAERVQRETLKALQREPGQIDDSAWRTLDRAEALFTRAGFQSGTLLDKISKMLDAAAESALAAPTVQELRDLQRELKEIK